MVVLIRWCTWCHYSSQFPQSVQPSFARSIPRITIATAAVDRSDRSRDRSIESIDSIDSIIFRSFEIFSNFRWRRCDSNGPKIIKIRAILAKKHFGRKIFGRKNSDEKNGGQGTGARHGRCGGKARVINGDSWGAKPPTPPRGARHG